MSVLCLLLVVISSSLGERLPKAEEIVNGEDCCTEEFPYVVSIRAGRPAVHVCGGSLVDGRHVLTAAHCYRRGARYHVVAGQTHLQEFREEIQVQRVARVFVHPLYRTENSTSDLAIFRLQDEIRQTMFTRYVRLPRRDQPLPCQRLRTAGWGSLVDTDVTKLTPLNLRCVRLAVLDRAACGMYYGPREAELAICTLETWTSRGVCFGDSGGPLMCGGVQYGIISWGVRCLGPLPQVHTNVSLHAGFIARTLRSRAAPHRSRPLRLLPTPLFCLLLCLLVT